MAVHRFFYQHFRLPLPEAHCRYCMLIHSFINHRRCINSTIDRIFQIRTLRKREKKRKQGKRRKEMRDVDGREEG